MARITGRVRRLTWRPFAGWAGPGVAFGAVRLALDARREVEAAQRKAAARVAS